MSIPPSTSTAVVDLSCELISRHSVTPNDDQCQQILAERLTTLGFEITHLPFNDVKNLWAITPGDGPVLCFAGHTDVVPAGNLEQWNTNPFQPTIDNGVLYGRGAADMKTAIAAMVVAVERFLKTNKQFNGRIAFLITSDEEGTATDGTVKVMQWLNARNINLDYCLIGEPSSSKKLGDTIKNGRRGSLNGKLTVYGTQGHIAYPHLADNPIHSATLALHELSVIRWDEGDDYFQPTQLQFSNIHSGIGVTNVIPGSLEALFNLRFSPLSSEKQLKEAIELKLKEFNLKYHIDWKLSGNPFITRGGKLVEAGIDSVNQVMGTIPQLSTNGGTSDGRFIAPYGVEVIELGVINETIHKVNECVSVKDIERLADIYQQILVNILCRGRL